MYDKFFNNFFIQNKNITIINAILTIMIYPLELILLSYLNYFISYHYHLIYYISLFYIMQTHKHSLQS